jgi:hypothetical protein
LVVFVVAVEVRYLSSVSSIGQEKYISRHELLGSILDGAEDVLGCGVAGEELPGREALGFGDPLHGAGIVLASFELTRPSAISGGVHTVDTDVDRSGCRHQLSS